MFHKECRKWRRHLPPLASDWPAFKLFATEAHQDWWDAQGTTAGLHFPVANLATPNAPVPTTGPINAAAIDALALLANATAHHRDTVATLTATIATLTRDLKTS